MAQLFSPATDTVARSVLVAALVVPFLSVALAYGVARSPIITDQKRVITQPVPFSHEHHAGELGIDCRYCHTGVEKAWYAGLPPTETCMTCHSQIWTNAAMLAPVRESLASATPIRWQRIYRIPDYVYFDHSVHVSNGVGCTTCHGPVTGMKLMYQQPPLTMGWCLDCHRDPAKNLRPRSEIFSANWQPSPNQAEQGHKLLAEYGIKVDHLTDCSVCHR